MYDFKLKDKMKKHITITVDAKIYEAIENERESGEFNLSKVINKFLHQYFQSDHKKKDSFNHKLQEVLNREQKTQADLEFLRYGFPELFKEIMRKQYGGENNEINRV